MKPLRLWPGVAIAVVTVLVVVIAPMLPGGSLYAMLGGALGALLILLWWLFFSRAAWLDRIAALVLVAVAVVLTKSLVDISIAGAGQGILVYVLGVQPLMLALVVWAAVTRDARPSTRRLALIATIILASVPINLLRTGGIGGSSGIDMHWRWTPTPEELLLARGPEELKPLTPLPAVETPAAPAAAPIEKPVAPAAPTPAAPIAEKRSWQRPLR
jgi:hypothetical protein